MALKSKHFGYFFAQQQNQSYGLKKAIQKSRKIAPYFPCMCVCVHVGANKKTIVRDRKPIREFPNTYIYI